MPRVAPPAKLTGVRDDEPPQWVKTNNSGRMASSFIVGMRIMQSPFRHAITAALVATAVDRNAQVIEMAAEWIHGT
jgi:hypothetical protein